MKPKYYWIKYTPEDEEPIITIGIRHPANKDSAAYWQVIGVDGMLDMANPAVQTWYDEIIRPDWLDEEMAFCDDEIMGTVYILNKWVEIPEGHDYRDYKLCGNCMGTGMDGKCPTCNGTGAYLIDPTTYPKIKSEKE